jgi:hypothetical protein
LSEENKLLALETKVLMKVSMFKRDSLYGQFGRAMAEAVSRWLPTAVAQVHARV